MMPRRSRPPRPGAPLTVIPPASATAQVRVDRGPLWYDFEIPNQFFKGLPRITNKLRWVREHLPREKRVKIGTQSAWYEQDILDYRASLEGIGAIPDAAATAEASHDA